MSGGPVPFLVTSLVFLIRFKGYWEDDWDISASKDIQEALLRDICSEMEREQEADRRAQWQHFHKLIEWGAKTVPLVKRVSLGGRVCLYGGYLVVSAFSLVVVALVVSASLILVGLILISAKETSALAGQSAHIWLMLPGHLVITRELVSLSVCLGAFAVFFLVAGQRTEDRKEFMDNVLAEVRRIFVVYSVYCRAHDHAEKWTKIRVDSLPLVPEVRQRRNHRPGVHPLG